MDGTYIAVAGFFVSLALNIILIVRVIEMDRKHLKNMEKIDRLNGQVKRRDWILREEKALIEELEAQEND